MKKRGVLAARAERVGLWLGSLEESSYPHQPYFPSAALSLLLTVSDYFLPLGKNQWEAERNGALKHYKLVAEVSGRL